MLKQISSSFIWVCAAILSRVLRRAAICMSSVLGDSPAGGRASACRAVLPALGNHELN